MAGYTIRTDDNRIVCFEIYEVRENEMALTRVFHRNGFRFWQKYMIFRDFVLISSAIIFVGWLIFSIFGILPWLFGYGFDWTFGMFGAFLFGFPASENLKRLWVFWDKTPQTANIDENRVQRAITAKEFSK